MIRFGSRGSDLALTQTKAVAEELRRRTGFDFEIEVFTTRGDKNLMEPLARIGGKGLFTAELEAALREERIDVAVHSLKDLPVEPPEGLCVGAIPERENPHDVLVFRRDARDPEGGTVPLLSGCTVGTSSPRRSASLLTLRPDLEVRDIRGNVDTRARKVAEGGYSATILAAAGLSRLGLETPELERCELPAEFFTPAPGQGALGVQCRAGDRRVLGLLAHLNDPTTAVCAGAERELLLRLGGGCSMPLGALAQPDGDGFRMQISLFSEHDPRNGTSFAVEARTAADLAPLAAEQLAPFRGEPLDGRHVVLLRPGGSDSRLARGIGLAGADVETVPVSEILPLDGEVASLETGDVRVVAFTSARAVDRFFEQAAASGRGGAIDLDAARIFAGGPATADAVRRRGHDCTAPADEAGGRALAELIIATLRPAAGPVLFPCAEDHHPGFEAAMHDAGFEVRALPVYRTLPLPGIEVPRTDHVVFTSPSAVRAYAAGHAAIGHPSRLALGTTTADAMERHGMPARGVADAPTAHALVKLILQLDGRPDSEPS